MCKTIFAGTGKGCIGKTMTTASLGIGLARQGKKVLLIDADSQSLLTISLLYIHFARPENSTNIISSDFLIFKYYNKNIRYNI